MIDPTENEMLRHRLQLLTAELNSTKDRLHTAEQLLAVSKPRELEMLQEAFLFLNTLEWYQARRHELQAHIKSIYAPNN